MGTKNWTLDYKTHQTIFYNCKVPPGEIATSIAKIFQDNGWLLLLQQR